VAQCVAALIPVHRTSSLLSNVHRLFDPSLFVLVVDASSQPEELNKKAVAILNRVRDKLTGIYAVNSL